MLDTIASGTILIREGTELPGAVRLESEPYAAGWRLVKNLDGHGLGRKIHEAGWTFFYLAGEIRATVFGIDGESMVRRAVERILANTKAEKFNSLEITRVTSVDSNRFLGVHHVTVSAHSRQIQESIFLLHTSDSQVSEQTSLCAAPEMRTWSEAPVLGKVF